MSPKIRALLSQLEAITAEDLAMLSREELGQLSDAAMYAMCAAEEEMGRRLCGTSTWLPPRLMPAELKWCLS